MKGEGEAQFISKQGSVFLKRAAFDLFWLSRALEDETLPQIKPWCSHA